MTDHVAEWYLAISESLSGDDVIDVVVVQREGGHVGKFPLEIFDFRIETKTGFRVKRMIS